MSALIKNDIDFLVERMYIDFTPDSPEFLVSPVTSIAQHCLNLKYLCTQYFIADRLWEVIGRERSRGFLTKLKTMPLLDHDSNNANSIVKYNAAAFKLDKHCARSQSMIWVWR